MRDTVNISKRDPTPYAHLEPGDEFILIKDEPITNIDTGRPVEIGDGIQLVHSTAEPGYVFEVRSITHETVYQLQYLGKVGDE